MSYKPKNFCDAVSERIWKIIEKTEWKPYFIEKRSGLQHGTFMNILHAKYNDITLSSVAKIAKGCNMSLLQFLNDEVFEI